MTAPLIAPVLVFGYGNPSRGDDALGPLLVSTLEGGAVHGDATNPVEFLTDFQLQIEHALDLNKRRLVLFADAHVGCAAPFEFTRLAEARDDSYTTHAMSPAAILHVYRRIVGAEPPPTYLLSLRGQRFELGEDLTNDARNHLTAALAFMRDLIRNATPEYWDRRARESAS